MQHNERGSAAALLRAEVLHRDEPMRLCTGAVITPGPSVLITTRSRSRRAAEQTVPQSSCSTQWGRGSMAAPEPPRRPERQLLPASCPTAALPCCASGCCSSLRSPRSGFLPCTRSVSQEGEITPGKWHTA